MTGVAVYILERVFGETPDSILLVIDIVSAFLMGGLSHIIHFHHDKKIHLPFRKRKTGRRARQMTDQPSKKTPHHAAFFLGGSVSSNRASLAGATAKLRFYFSSHLTLSMTLRGSP